MAVDLERLVVQLSADVKQYNNALNKAMGLTNKQAKSIENRFQKMNAGVSTSFIGLGKTIVGVLAGSAILRSATRFADAATRIDNALKIAGLSGEELEKVYNRLRTSATRNAAPIEALVELYGRAALVQKELGISGEELLNFTDKIAVALRVSGKSASEASGALLQLSQALGSGVVRAEEFNSILEGALPIAQAAAAGLKEAGGSVAKLRQLVVDGQVSSEAFFRAFEAGAPILEEKVANATFTVAQATGNLSTALVDVAREFNTSTGAGERFAGGINNAAQAIADFDVSGFIRKIQEAGGVLEKFLNDIGSSSYMEQFAEWLTGTELTPGKPISIETIEAEQDLAGLERQIKVLEDRINANKEMAIDTTEAEANLNGLLAKANALRTALAGGAVVNDESATNSINRMVPFNPLGPLPTTAKQVSLDDFDAPTKKGKGRGGRGGSRDKKDEWQREVEQIKERTEAILAETAAMAGLNPLIEDYGYTLEKARAKQDLLTAAKRAGLAITPQLEAQIEQLAESYAQASVAAEQLAEAQENARQAAEDMRDLGKDVMGGFIQDMVAGKSAADALANALGKIGDKLLELAMNNLFGGSGSGGFGILDFLVNGFKGFAGGGYTGPGGKNQPAGVVHKGEVVWSQKDVARAGGVGAVEAMRRGLAGYDGGGPVAMPQFRAPSMPRLQAPAGQAGPSITFAPVIDARGADVAAVERLAQVMEKQKREFEANVVSTIRNARSRRVPGI